MPARLLCIGDDVSHLETRCAVLSLSGYDAQLATLPEAETILRTERFDLVVFSAWLGEWAKGKILAAAGNTPVLMLTELTYANDLLAQVKRMAQQDA
jgi:DNA-binding response OmpR family regulator